MIQHFVSLTCEGERCSLCGAPATHKVGEEIPWDEPLPAWALEWVKPRTANTPMRHNFTAYVCCRHFRAILGGAVPCPVEPIDREGGA